MDPQWQYNPLVLPLGFSVILVILLIVIGIYHRRTSIVTAYLLFLICTLIWLSMSLLETITLNFKLSLFFADISFLGITFIPVVWLGITMIYIGREQLLKRILPALLTIPILTNVIIWTNPLHHLWRGNSTRDLTTTWFPISYYDYGDWFSIIHTPFSLTLALLTLAILTKELFSRDRFYRTQIILMLLAINLPILVEVLYRLGFELIPYFNASSLVFPISGIIVGIVTLRYNFLDLTPIARDLVVDNMNELMIVIDENMRLMDANPAARKHLFDNRQVLIGQYITELIPDQAHQLLTAVETTQKRDEIILEKEGQKQIYEINVSNITSPYGEHTSKVLLLHNVTEQKKTEQALYQQVRQVAVLEERQRLARELHDSVNQTLFATRTLVDLLPRAIKHKPEKVDEYVFNIQQLIHGTTAEMRLILLELYPNALLETDLGTLIKNLCDAYTGTTGTPIDQSMAPMVNLDEEDQIAFYRITQEALNNISKHTSATQVFVHLQKTEHQVELKIEDNGEGFFLEQQDFNGHFGLKNMADRAANIHAHFEIRSKPNKGTTITVVKELS